MPAFTTQSPAQLPELPALSAMLRGARPVVAADWRSGVWAALQGGANLGAAPAPAGIAASALEPGADRGVCFVTPVHAAAGMSRVHLAPGEQLRVTAPEREALLTAFNAQFGDDALRLHAAGSGWLLTTRSAAAAGDADPQVLRGVALEREPAHSDAARQLRRLGAEVEMWLATHPVNQAREVRRLPPINCFWFWGGAMTQELAASRHHPSMIASNEVPDAWLAGLARHCMLPAPMLVAQWSEIASDSALLVLQPAELHDPVAQLAGWEERFLAPAWRDLGARRRPALRLQIGSSAWDLPAPRWARWLRRAQPWWQQVSA